MTTALSKAIQKKDQAEVLALIKKPEIELNTLDEKGMTPLLEAITQDSEELAITILNSGRTNPNIATRKGSTPLMTAIANKHYKLIDKLLEHKPPVNLWAKKHDTTLMNAAMKEAYMSRSKNYVDLPPPASFNTALDYAAQSNQVEVIEKIIKKATENQRLNFEYYTNALLIAATYGCQEATYMLIKHGADVSNRYLLTCAAASEKYQKLEKDRAVAQSKAVNFIDTLISKHANTDEWSYNGNNPGIRIIYLRTQLQDIKLELLATAAHKQQMHELISLVSHRNTSKLNDQCCALIARIAYAHYITSHNDDDLITACHYWSKITDVNNLHHIDKSILSTTINLTPLWLRGSSYAHHKTNLNNLTQEKSWSMTRFQQKQSIVSKPSPAFDKLIDNTLHYLATRNTETKTQWFGYSAQDYSLRREVTDKITLHKLEYQNTGDVKQLLSIKNIINEALQKKEITGRYCISSHRFADHLQQISNFIENIPEFKEAEEERVRTLRDALFRRPGI